MTTQLALQISVVSPSKCSTAHVKLQRLVARRNPLHPGSDFGLARRPRHRSPRTRDRNVPPAPSRSARHPAKHRPHADRQPRPNGRFRWSNPFSARRRPSGSTHFHPRWEGRCCSVHKNKAGISGGQDGFQDEQTTKDRRGPSSVVFLTCEYPCQTGMAASSQKSSPTALPRQIPYTPYFHRTLLPDTASVR